MPVFGKNVFWGKNVFRPLLTGMKRKLDRIFTEFEVFSGLRFGFRVGRNTFFSKDWHAGDNQLRFNDSLRLELLLYSS
jgi:hypothetical protein